MPARSERPGDDPVLELEFVFDGPTYPVVRASAVASCRFELEEMAPRDGDRYAEFYSVHGAAPAAVESMVPEYPSMSLTVLERYEDGGLLELRFGERCPAVGLAELGALPRSVVAEDGEGVVVAELLPPYDAREVVSRVESEYDGELVAKREREAFTPLFSRRELDRALERRLTDRQHEVLEAAFEAGYYDWPRETSGEELARRLGISQPTLSEHLTTAERKLLSLVFER